jgi:hypothetical protein
LLPGHRDGFGDSCKNSINPYKREIRENMRGLSCGKPHDPSMHGEKLGLGFED